MKRGAEGWVLAMLAPPPGGSGAKVTVFWCGPEDPTSWAPSQQSAARFVDESLARHILSLHPARTHRPAHVYAVPALAGRNGGPTAPIITWPEATTPQVEPVQEQGDLFS